MPDPREVYPDPIRQGTYPSILAKNALPKRVAFATAYEYVSKQIIDEFQHQNWFFSSMPRMTITDSVNNGQTYTYKYHRAVNLPSATARKFNMEVEPTYTELKSEETNIVNLASAYSMDIDLMNIGGVVSQWPYQIARNTQGISDLFNEMVIRGDASVPDDPTDPAVGSATFYGLDKIIRTDSLHVWDDVFDLTGLGYTTLEGDIGVNALWMDVVDELMARIDTLRPRPTFVLGNRQLISALSALGRRTGMYQTGQDQFGHRISSIDGIALIPMGKRCAKNEEIIKTVKSNTKCRENKNSEADKTFETVAYFGSFGPTAVMGLQLHDNPVMIHQTTFGYMRKWDIEMQIGMCVKSRHACGMFTKICLPRKVIEFPEYLDGKPAV